jgi:hypothetical protein
MNMSKPELARRMKTITHAAFLRMLSDVRAGEGPTMVKGNLHTLKQANAAYAWVARYGAIQPTADQCAPCDAPKPTHTMLTTDDWT